MLGTIYVVVGAFYILGKAGLFKRSLGPKLSHVFGTRGSLILETIFAFNIPACAGPLLAVLLAMSAAGGAGGTSLAKGFTTMALFGLALSLPIVAATFFDRARSTLDRLVAWSARMPRWTGLILIFSGAWSIRFGLIATLR